MRRVTAGRPAGIRIVNRHRHRRFHAAARVCHRGKIHRTENGISRQLRDLRRRADDLQCERLCSCLLYTSRCKIVLRQKAGAAVNDGIQTILNKRNVERVHGLIVLFAVRPVSYTHLDVYKRQPVRRSARSPQRSHRSLGAFRCPL